MRKLLVLILFSFITLNAFLPVVLSDAVEITIEYETTTTVPGATTTTVSGPGGLGGTTTTITLPEEIVPGALVSYSMPTSYELYQNEIGTFTINVMNDGTKILHDVRIGVSGIPADSLSVSPDRVGFLEPSKSTSFYLSINPQNVTPDTYTLTITIVSDETYEITYLTLKVNPFTREVAEKIKEQEEFEKVTKPALISINSILIGVVLTSSIVAAIMLMRFRVNRCPLCGGKVVKEYEGDNFISYKCSECTYYRTKVRKK